MAGLTYAVDQRLSFSVAILVSHGPKLRFQSDVQDKTNAGVPKWQAMVSVVGISENGMPPGNDNLMVGINSAEDPFRGLTQGALVTFDNLRIGVSTPEVKQKDGGSPRVAGGKAWFTASGIRAAGSPAQEAISKHFPKAEAAS